MTAKAVVLVSAVLNVSQKVQPVKRQGVFHEPYE